ncbi:SDR family NAD(P)-dependent oxidoreductase [Salipaludibacillus sp. HK11]|uniref:SDR family NAD(P)-dependent oxidoreductase n=1 Tax=Salipaludibacillus sp. HK11 TaxID=3394320 RepID=UPI0039FC0544
MEVLITGANRGLGLALTKTLITSGHKVIAIVRSEQSNCDNLRCLLDKHAERLLVFYLDVTNETEVQELAFRLKEKDVQLDGLINNAGILLGRNESIENLVMNKVRDSFAINVYGSMNIIKHTLPLMNSNSEQQKIILTISSEAGSITNAYDGDYPYAISKAAVNMFTKQIKEHVKGGNTRVFVIHPGWMRTDMGGENALVSPNTTAEELMKIIEGRIDISDDYFFINYLGEPMDL